MVTKASLFSSLAAGSCLAVSILPRDIAKSAAASDDHRHYALPISHQVHHRPELSRRAADDADVPLYNVSFTSYLISLNIGTPGQEIFVAIDTGSDELWVNPDCSDADRQQMRDNCKEFGQYKLDDSSSGEKLDGTNVLHYGIGDVKIQYVKDDIMLPNSSIDLSDVQFGMATRSQDLSEGILGLGFGNDVNLKYNNFVDELQTQGATNVRAFSIALGSIDDDDGGVVIFGGVDDHKWVGNLTKLDILSPQNGESLHRYWVNLNSVGHTNTNGEYAQIDDSSTTVVVDSGTSFTYLPSTIIESIAHDLEAEAQSGYYFVSCDLMDQEGSIDFTFDGVTISVPYYEIIVVLAVRTDSAGNVLEQVCGLGMQSSDTTGSSSADGVTPQVSISLLGDTFMRSAYIIFDQDSEALWMAPYAKCGKGEQTIPKDGVGALNLTGVCTESVSASKYRGAAPRMAGSTWLAAAAVAVCLLKELM